MTILVLNANGKTGSAVAKALLAKGEKVSVGGRDTAKLSQAFPTAKAVKFDYTEEASMQVALNGADAVFTSAPYEMLPEAEIKLAHAAKAAGTKRIVKLSAAFTKDDPTQAHQKAIDAIAATGIDYTILEATFFMQNYIEGQADLIRNKRAFYEPASEGKTAFIDVGDIGEAAATVLTSSGHHDKIYQLTGPEALSRLEVAHEIGHALGHPIAYVPIDEAAMRVAMAGAPPKLVDFLCRLMRLVRDGKTSGVYPDLEKLIGRKPTRFADFAKANVSAWQ